MIVLVVDIPFFLLDYYNYPYSFDVYHVSENTLINKLNIYSCHGVTCDLVLYWWIAFWWNSLWLVKLKCFFCRLIIFVTNSIKCLLLKIASFNSRTYAKIIQPMKDSWIPWRNTLLDFSINRDICSFLFLEDTVFERIIKLNQWISFRTCVPVHRTERG